MQTILLHYYAMSKYKVKIQVPSFQPYKLLSKSFLLLGVLLSGEMWDILKVAFYFWNWNVTLMPHKYWTRMEVGIFSSHTNLLQPFSYLWILKDNSRVEMIYATKGIYWHKFLPFFYILSHLGCQVQKHIDSLGHSWPLYHHFHARAHNMEARSNKEARKQ